MRGRETVVDDAAPGMQPPFHRSIRCMNFPGFTCGFSLEPAACYIVSAEGERRTVFPEPAIPAGNVSSLF